VTTNTCWRFDLKRHGDQGDEPFDIETVLDRFGRVDHRKVGEAFPDPVPPEPVNDVDYRTADRATVDAEMRRLGISPRQH
jgi:hypothetical protein